MMPRRLLRAERGSAIGNIITALLIVALLGLGAWLVLKNRNADSEGAPAADARPAAEAPKGDAPDPIEPVTGTPVLEAAAPYTPKDKIVEIDLSEYAGYGGLIVANGGLEPNPNSFFAKEYGFQVKLSVSESETWSKLNNGKLAATATTADALAVLGRQFEAVVPVQIGYSRGADMVVVDAGVTSVNNLAGKTLAASQFNESEFFIRYLAQEAGVPVRVLRDLDGKPAANELGLVFYEDAFVACDAYQHELARKSPRLNGCVGWTPRTDEVVQASNGRAKVLVSNRNLLVIADVLTLNKEFAQKNPDIVRGLVHGVLEGNRLLRDSPDQHIGVVAAAFKWDEAEARDELAHVHLSNLPENQAFFSGTLDVAGSFGGIFQSSVLAYGSIIKNPTDPQRFVDTSALAEFRSQGGEELVRTMALQAMELSRQRATAVRDALLARHKELETARIETVGRGWEEPMSPQSDQNRRVEVQWFTLE
jgi:NitT/TauT family transport system substrate-binding protein